ncbi:hypothetical protein [Paenibacillus sp.]|uniref:hypothetical protein n=1 Tax=Paenibacillus sp. TaxID=58172 RepID=UPI002D6B82BE|nr:hypothetical protein [Paenibacillus sp.]HZG55881.1 hypothetical protein [Paenibacillus sp.]
MSEQWERPLNEGEDAAGGTSEPAVAADASTSDPASASFGPETEFESESSVSDKAFFQEESVNPVAMRADSADGEAKAESYDAEFGGELSAVTPNAASGAAAGSESTGGMAAGATIGLIAIVMAAVSFFFLQSILGPAAVVVGFMAYAKGRKALGAWSMLLGTISFVMFLLSLQHTAVY